MPSLSVASVHSLVSIAVTDAALAPPPDSPPPHSRGWSTSEEEASAHKGTAGKSMRRRGGLEANHLTMIILLILSNFHGQCVIQSWCFRVDGNLKNQRKVFVQGDVTLSLFGIFNFFTRKSTPLVFF